MKTTAKILSLFMLVTVMQTTTTAQNKPHKGLITQITYYVPSRAAALDQPIIGVTDHLQAEIDYDDTSVINELNFEVFLSTFIDNSNYGTTSYIASMGNVYRFPEMSFISNSVKEDRGKLEIKGVLYFRGEYRSTTIDAKRLEDDDLIQIQGNFTIFPRGHTLMISGLRGNSFSPASRSPARITFQFNLNFPKV